MTQSAVEVLIMQLARSGGRAAHKFLHARGLQKSDRDDVISAALLWCWENRANYSLTTTLETWFMNTVRNAYQDLRRDELPTSNESIERFGSSGRDETYNAVAAEDAVSAIARELTPDEQRVAVLTMDGYTKEEMVEYHGLSLRHINESREAIKRLRELMPDDDADIYRVLINTPPAGGSDDASDALSQIDVEIEQLDFPPPHGADCPPCWRCMWFEGFMPSGKRDTRMVIEDAEVREAVKNTEARKIEIAQAVRDGAV